MAQEEDSHKGQLQARWFFGNKPLKYFTILCGESFNSNEDFKKRLKKEVPSLQEVSRKEDCDIILLFCTIVSRAGTDIAGALKKLHDIEDSKPAVLVVLHHTFDPDSVVSASNSSVCGNRKDILRVDCVFFEERGLLHCPRNDEAIGHIKNWIKQPGAASRSTAKPTKPSSEETSQKSKFHLDDFTGEQQRMKEVEKQVEAEEKKIQNTNFQEIILATKLRLVLVGKTASAAENIILGREQRQAEAPLDGQQSESRQGEVDGMQVTVVDTPEELRKNMELKANLSARGPHAFLLVVPVKETSGEERGILEELEKIFRGRCLKNTMILFTTTDLQQKKEVEEWIQTGDQEIQRLVEKCGNRFHSLNINERGDGSQVSELLEKIEDMLARKNDSGEVYQMVGDVVRKIEEREARIREMSKKIQEGLKRNEEFIHGYESDISDLGNKKERNSEQMDNIKLITTAKELYETKNEIGGRIRKLYERVAGMEEDRKFIKVMLPEHQQPVWLSLPSRQEKLRSQMDEELENLHELFCSNVEHLRGKKKSENTD